MVKQVCGDGWESVRWCAEFVPIPENGKANQYFFCLQTNQTHDEDE
jgi:hypothetical protein